jgi:hypothetical protein
MFFETEAAEVNELIEECLKSRQKELEALLSYWSAH